MQTLYALEELHEAFHDRGRALDAANIAARIKLVRQKLGLPDFHDAWKPLPPKQQMLLDISFWVIAGILACGLLILRGLTR